MSTRHLAKNDIKKRIKCKIKVTWSPPGPTINKLSEFYYFYFDCSYFFFFLFTPDILFPIKMHSNNSIQHIIYLYTDFRKCLALNAIQSKRSDATWPSKRQNTRKHKWEKRKWWKSKWNQIHWQKLNEKRNTKEKHRNRMQRISKK